MKLRIFNGARFAVLATLALLTVVVLLNGPRAHAMQGPVGSTEAQAVGEAGVQEHVIWGVDVKNYDARVAEIVELVEVGDRTYTGFAPRVGDGIGSLPQRAAAPEDKPSEMVFISSTPGVALHVYKKRTENDGQFQGRAANEAHTFWELWGAPPSGG